MEWKDLKWFEDLCYLITGGALWLTTYGLGDHGSLKLIWRI
jgi:hypothetical protein